MLGFNAPMITIGTHPVSASLGAPLSVDAATQPLRTIASLIGVVPFLLSSGFILRALLIGEEFDAEGGEDDPDALRRRLIAVHPIDRCTKPAAARGGAIDDRGRSADAGGVGVDFGGEDGGVSGAPIQVLRPWNCCLRPWNCCVLATARR